MSVEIPVEYYGGEYDSEWQVIRAIHEALADLPLSCLDIELTTGTIHKFVVMIDSASNEQLQQIYQQLTTIKGLEIGSS
ncbi:MAG TPA: hypothetical protein VF209_00715 [Patescibacteria group bacterium]